MSKSAFKFSGGRGRPNPKINAFSPYCSSVWHQQQTEQNWKSLTYRDCSYGELSGQRTQTWIFDFGADKTLERALGFPVSTVPVGAPVLLPASWNEPRQGSEFTKQWNFDFHLVRLGN